MTQFTEANTVRDYVQGLVADLGAEPIPGPYLERTPSTVMLEGRLRDALVRLNTEIAAKLDRADQVLHELNRIVAEGRHGSLVRQNELFTSWMRGEHSMPFGLDGAHTTVRLVDFDNPAANDWIVSTEVTFRQGHVERRFDLVIWCNGIPIAVGEAKRADRSAASWFDAAAQIHGDYEKNVPLFFVPNVLSIATEGRDFRYGTVAMPEALWGPWRDDANESGMAHVADAAQAVLSPSSLLLFLRYYTVFATNAKHRRIKVIARYQQFQAAELILARVVDGTVKQGLVWHFQGSGKSLLMVFAAMRLRTHPALGSPTVFIIVDRIDLDTQITGTFSASDVPNIESVETRAQLEELVHAGSRKVIITTIHKFAELPENLDTRSNIVVMADEAHRTQEGQFADKMRQALPNAFFFGMTGSPIGKRDRNTFRNFGYLELDGRRFLSRYSFEESVRDGATLPLHFATRPTDVHIDREAIDAGAELIAQEEQLTDDERRELIKRAASLERLIKAPGRIGKITADIANHFRTHVEPDGLKAQVVVYDKEACVLYKQALDQHLDHEASTVVMSVDARDPQEWRDSYGRDRDAEQVLLDRFRDPADPLKILIVTAKLLTGFDAPILQTQYLDRPLRDHTLLQAICRTNRTYPGKTHGLIVDYLGLFDDVAQSLAFDEEGVNRIITNIEKLKEQFPDEMDLTLAFFLGVDRTEGGYTGMLAAQAMLPDQDALDRFGAQYRVVGKLWEAISPDPMLMPYQADYRWLTSVYESVKPVDLTGRLVWSRLGAKTLELINEHVQVEVPRLDLDTIVLDADLLADLTSGDPTGNKAKEIETAITARIARHLANPTFVELGKRLEQLRLKYAEGQQQSIEFLRSLLELAKDTLAAERAEAEITSEERAKAALTELFENLKDSDTPVMVERLVADIDKVVRQVRYDGWQDNPEGDREVKKVLRQILWLRYKVRDEDIFAKAHGYIREYY